MDLHPAERQANTSADSMSAGAKTGLIFVKVVLPVIIILLFERQLYGEQKIESVSDITTVYLDSIFVRIKAETRIIPVQRPGTGGGLTSFGDAVVLLTHEGKIYALRSAEEILETQIQVPDNGYRDYEKAASTKYKDYVHNFYGFRYNDILYFNSGVGQGFAISYTEFNKMNECYRTTVSVLFFDHKVQAIEHVSAGEEDWNVVYRTQPCLPLKKEEQAIEGQMSGGRMAFGHADKIYLASGDYHWDGVYAPEAIAQNPNMDYGKVIEIDLAKREGRIVSSGNRNMQGIAIDHDGELWGVEHGPRGGDELNHILPGENYGWPEETLGTGYNKFPWPNTRSYGRHETFKAPVFAWLPSVAPSGLTLIEGFHESWDGDLLMGTLKDQSLHRIRIKDGRVMFAERIPVNKRIRYVHQHSDGRLVLWTDDKHIMFLDVDEGGFVAEFIDNYIEQSKYSDVERRKVKSALGLCRECHSFDPGDHANAPSLGNIFEAPIAATSYSGYSEALKGRSGRWSRTELRAFLSDPAAYAPGTVMPQSGLNDPFIVNALIDLLEALSKEAQ